MFEIGDALYNIHSVFSESPELTTCAGVLIGMLIGNWLAIGKDKRAEFIAAAAPLRDKLLQQLGRVSNGYHFEHLSVTYDQFSIFSHYIGWCRKKRYHTDVNNYLKCFETFEHICAAGVVYKKDEVDKIALEKAIRKLLKYLTS